VLKKPFGQKRVFLLITFLTFFSSCLGVGMSLREEKVQASLPYEQAFERALKAAKEMEQRCKEINSYNFPAIVSVGTSKSRGVITLVYQFDPAWGSLCTKPPKVPAVEEAAKILFVPRFGAKFYLHVRFLKEKNVARGVRLEVTQSSGVKKESFRQEMEKFKNTYLVYLNRHWQ